MTFRHIFRLLAGVAVLATASGCENARTRARDHAAVFGGLTPSDQRLVLSGRVRDGMNAEAIYIAWGNPDEKQTSGGGKEAAESWIYRRQLTVKAPMGSFDQWSVGNSVFGMTVPLVADAGYGFGGIGNEGALLYQPHLQIPDATVKEAEFVGGKLESYRIHQGEFTLPR